jgi:hypothetical protein
LIVDRQVEKNDLENSNTETTVPENLSEAEVRRQEALSRWETNCEKDGGTWISEYEMCYSEENAERMRESCEDIGGTWLEDSMIYECEIKGEMFKLGEWEMINWEVYDERKESCLDYNGEWLGGAQMACTLDGDTFYQGKWMVLDEMEESCVNEFGGEWLGGEETKCLIDEQIYPGNWVQVFAMKDSCEDVGGEWLGGDNNYCQVNDKVYSHGAWERIDEMKESCEDVGGEYIGGDRFNCDLDGDIYFNKKWERVAKAPSMGEICIEDGGEWSEANMRCQGLDKQWCDDILVELELGSVAWNEDESSCFIY